MKATQHESKYESFLSIRKTYGSVKNEKTISAHFFTPSLEGFKQTTRFQKTGKDDKTGEDIFKEVTGVFLDSVSAVIASITVLAPKKLISGKEIPESVAVDLLSEDKKSINRVTFTSDSKFGDHFLRRVNAVNFEKEVTLSPYAFYPENKTEVSQGMTVIQEGNKLDDQFADWKSVDGKNVLINKNGLEQFDADATKAKAMEQGKLRSAEWKRYFALVNEFLIKELKKSKVYESKIELSQHELSESEKADKELDELASELLEGTPF